MGYFDEALRLKPELIRYRRDLHRNAEVGCHLPKTVRFVKEELEKLGYSPIELCDSGLMAVVGKGEKTVLLRADMDALPMEEMSGLDFASQDKCAAHTCGHDLHAAALIGAARLLKEHESDLNGKVKLMFQPGEEIFKGAKAMIEAGILENPAVDIAFAQHVTPRYPTGIIASRSGAAMASCFGFKIHIQGRASHGANPEDGVDPINIGVHIHLALQELIAREVNFQAGATLTIGSFHAGSAPNNIPQDAELSGTLRTFDNNAKEFLMGRIRETVQKTAELFRGQAEIEELSNVPSEINDPRLTETVRSYARKLYGEKCLVEDVLMTGSEDFAFITEKVPSVIVFVGARDPQHEGSFYPGHHPKVMFDENVLPICTSLYVEVATRWLNENA